MTFLDQVSRRCNLNIKNRIEHESEPSDFIWGLYIVINLLTTMIVMIFIEKQGDDMLYNGKIKYKLLNLKLSMVFSGYNINCMLICIK